MTDTTAAHPDAARSQQIVTELAAHIRRTLLPVSICREFDDPKLEAKLASPGIRVHDVRGEPMPKNVESIARHLASGDIWLSWIDGKVLAGLRELARLDTAPCRDCGQFVQYAEQDWYAVDSGGVCALCAIRRYGDKAADYLIA